jgi:TolA-binding protein
LTLRRIVLVGSAFLAVLFGAIVLLHSPGYQLQPTVITQLHSVSSQVDSGNKQLTQVSQQIQSINQAISALQQHLQDDINTYHTILSKAGQ